jgi:hypothetical protein
LVAKDSAHFITIPLSKEKLSNVARQRVAHATSNKGHSPANPLQALVRCRAALISCEHSKLSGITLENRKKLFDTFGHQRWFLAVYMINEYR